MIKIKDNVDLKELEKYGFTIDKDTKMEYYFDFVPYNANDNYNSTYVLINKYGKIIDAEEIQREHANSLIDLIYDLIQDGLVEKVEE